MDDAPVVLKSNQALKTTRSTLQSAEQSELTYFKAATSDNTRRAYQSDIRAFIAWGGLLPCTTRQILSYLENQALYLNPRTLARRLTALKQWHHYQGLPDPTDHPLIKKTLSGIARTHGRPKVPAPALTLSVLDQWITYLDQHSSLANIRNKALILVGFFGALRASELVAITTEAISWEEAGIRIQLPRSKTDPIRQGQSVAIPYAQNATRCAVRALKNWLNESGIQSDSVFRALSKKGCLKKTSICANSLNPLIKNLATAAQLPFAQSMSSHSLRRGLATEASRHGASMKAIMKQGRWKDVRTVLVYIEEGEAFDHNVVNLFSTS